jgi:hypothetical protein
MSVVARLLSSGVARGLAALLAVLLSAVIGGRLGVDRLSLDLSDEECSPVDCPLMADLTADAAVVVCIAASDQRWSEPCERPLVAHLPTAADHRPFPGLLRGSAGGARAP